MPPAVNMLLSLMNKHYHTENSKFSWRQPQLSSFSQQMKGSALVLQKCYQMQCQSKCFSSIVRCKLNTLGRAFSVFRHKCSCAHSKHSISVFLRAFLRSGKGGHFFPSLMLLLVFQLSLFILLLGILRFIGRPPLPLNCACKLADWFRREKGRG